MSSDSQPERLPKSAYAVAGTILREIDKTEHEEFTYILHRENLNYMFARLPDGSRFNFDVNGRWMELHRWDGERVFGLSWHAADDLVLCESALAMCRRAIHGPPQPLDEMEKEFVAMLKRGDLDQF